MSFDDGVQWVWVVALVCLLLGASAMASPRRAVTGNRVMAAALAVATLAAVTADGVRHRPLIAVAILLGVLIAAPTARMVPLAAASEGAAVGVAAGGLSAALVSIVALDRFADALDGFRVGAVVFGVVAGALAAVAAILPTLRDLGVVPSRPARLPRAGLVLGGLGFVHVVAWSLIANTRDAGWVWLLLLAALALGVVVCLPLDVRRLPLMACCAEVFAGIGVLAVGVLVGVPLVIVAGGVSAAAGVVVGGRAAGGGGGGWGSLARSLLGVFASTPPHGEHADDGESPRALRVTPADVAVMLAYARRVVVVPGFGLAVAQGHFVLRELVTLLQRRGVEAVYAIHPLAGRLPGQLNVLLAEADVPYGDLVELERANLEFDRTDVVLVVGANDVVNGAAVDGDQPRSGVPVLEVSRAAHVVVLDDRAGPGHSGAENALLYDEKTLWLPGDAKATLTAVLTAVKGL